MAGVLQAGRSAPPRPDPGAAAQAILRESFSDLPIHERQV